MPDFETQITRELQREIKKFEKRTGITLLGFAFSIPEKVNGIAYGMLWREETNLTHQEQWYTAMEIERVPELPSDVKETVKKKPN